MLIPLLKGIRSYSPYIYCANNPVRFIDPDGRFLIDVHRRIVENAFKQFMFNRVLPSSDIQAFERAVVGYGISPYRGSVAAPDVRTLPWYIGGGSMPSIDSEHFDNMNYSQIMNNFALIKSGINSSVSMYRKGIIDAKGLGNVVGEYYHAIADFYSHSNYIELYESVYGQTSFDQIPTIDEAFANKKYSTFVKILKANLRTGQYSETEHLTNGTSHKQMNHDLGAGSIYSSLEEVKDKEVNWNSKAAEATATKATVEYTYKIEKKDKIMKSYKRRWIILTMLVINIIIALIANYLILTGYWHYGKDGGFFPRMECSIILTPITYFIMTDSKKLIFLISGFFIGYLSIIISMLIINRYTNLSSIFYHILSIFFSFLIFILMQKMVFKKRRLIK